MTKQNYQNDLSIHSPILLDLKHKQPKVDKMLAILSDAGILQLGGIAIDVGCSRGFFASGIAPFFTKVFGVDIDKNALDIAKSENTHPNLQFMEADSINLPFPNESIDLVICNHVYEHVPNAQHLFAEIKRILKPTGACYLGAASRLTIIEPHYHLPFLSWLPKIVANKYVKAMGKCDYYYENLQTYWGIRNLISDFSVSDYTLEVLMNPDRYHARDLISQKSIINKVPLAIWKLLYQFLPSYIFILRRNQS